MAYDNRYPASDVRPVPYDNRPIPGDVRPALYDTRYPPHDIRSAPYDARPVPIDGRLAPYESSYSAQDIRSAPYDNRPPPGDIRQLPYDNRYPPADARLAPYDHRPLPGDASAVPYDNRYPPPDIRSAPYDNRPLPTDIRPAPYDSRQPVDCRKGPYDNRLGPHDNMQIPGSRRHDDDDRQPPYDGRQGPYENKQPPVERRPAPYDGRQVLMNERDRVYTSDIDRQQIQNRSAHQGARELKPVNEEFKQNHSRNMQSSATNNSESSTESSRRGDKSNESSRASEAVASRSVSNQRGKYSASDAYPQKNDIQKVLPTESSSRAYEVKRNPTAHPSSYPPATKKSQHHNPSTSAAYMPSADEWRRQHRNDREMKEENFFDGRGRQPSPDRRRLDNIPNPVKQNRHASVSPTRSRNVMGAGSENLERSAYRRPPQDPSFEFTNLVMDETGNKYKGIQRRN